MKQTKSQSAFTLVEVMVVIVIMMVIIGALIGVGKMVHDQAREKVTKSTMRVVSDALGEYQSAKQRGNAAFMFPPPGALDFSTPDISTYASLVVSFNTYTPYSGFIVTADNAGTHDSLLPPVPRHVICSTELVFAFLSDVPACRELLEKLPQEAVKNNDGDSVFLRNKPAPLMEIYDAWGQPLLYRREADGNFPTLISAGKDELFNTEDDILSTEF